MKFLQCIKVMALFAIAAHLQGQPVVLPGVNRTNADTTGTCSISADGIENFFRLTARVYSGSTPANDEAFAELKRHGIKTIISVDGGKPDVEAAKRHGLRYIHLPIGYDGVSGDRIAQFIKAGETVPQPIFVHCHHGQHRGPTGAAIICLGTEGWTPKQAMSWLKQAGTATNYAGLYRSVEQFQRPSDEALKRVSTHLPEKAETSKMVDAMVEIEKRFEHLKLAKEAGYRVPTSHPDIDPKHEALLFHELFKELLRSSDTKKQDNDFLAMMQEAEQAARDFYFCLNNPAVEKDKAEAAFQKINKACSVCHKAFRN